MREGFSAFRSEEVSEVYVFAAGSHEVAFRGAVAADRRVLRLPRHLGSHTKFLSGIARDRKLRRGTVARVRARTLA